MPRKKAVVEEAPKTVPVSEELEDVAARMPEDNSVSAEEEKTPPAADEAAPSPTPDSMDLPGKPPGDEGGAPPGKEDAPPGPSAEAVPQPVELPSAESALPPAKSDRQMFYETDFNYLDRGLSPEERQEWNSIYASYRGHSALSGQIAGVNPRSICTRNKATGQLEWEKKLCATVILYRVPIMIPVDEMWMPGEERPDYVFQSTEGATIDFIITLVDREGEFVLGSRRMTMESQRRFFARRPALNREGTRLTCRVLSVGPRRCLVECYGHDIDLTQRDLSYTAIPNLKDEYQVGRNLDCILKQYDREADSLVISVKETEPDPYDGAELRHPKGSRRIAKIAGKYAGGVFCNLPDGTVCMCCYSYQYTDSDFQIDDTVVLRVQDFNDRKRQMYGRIVSRW